MLAYSRFQALVSVHRDLLMALFAVFLGGAVLAVAHHFDTSMVTIETAHRDVHFVVEVASSPAAQRQGLMYRKHLASDAGMLFVFPEEKRVSFWMKDTYIPLDMIFIDSSGTIVDIHENAVPLSRSLITPSRPARAVLEVNAGAVARIQIRDGDLVKSVAFGDKP